MSEHQPALELIGEGPSFRGELCSMIEQAQLFGDLPRNDIEQLANYVQAYHAAKGATIFREGEKGAFMCVVVDGRVDILKENQDRQRKLITNVRPGKSMGEMSVVDDQPYSATAIASQDTRLLMITKHRLQQLTQEHPALGVKVVWRLAKLISFRLRQTTGVLLDYLQ